MWIPTLLLGILSAIELRNLNLHQSYDNGNNGQTHKSKYAKKIAMMPLTMFHITKIVLDLTFFGHILFLNDLFFYSLQQV